ncbi:hypothetical protein GH741_17125 [Aquibacillus halophilus]|uniref:Uncharacterized protein n=1 Tax=Aquibacillus halophilus TaxID=930132 RepID=A0A6A8DF78_9BACI|nr:hypothetical protein [Aquibacillus halophilus]MRH44368.1 hypothetical protein [Aquibacillus halophilus]
MTEEEIQSQYDQIVIQQGEDAPALEEVKDQIKNAIMNQKKRKSRFYFRDIKRRK